MYLVEEQNQKRRKNPTPRGVPLRLGLGVGVLTPKGGEGNTPINTPSLWGIFLKCREYTPLGVFPSFYLWTSGKRRGILFPTPPKGVVLLPYHPFGWGWSNYSHDGPPMGIHPWKGCNTSPQGWLLPSTPEGRLRNTPLPSRGAFLFKYILARVRIKLNI